MRLTVRWRIRPLRAYSRPLRPSSSLEICSRRVSSETGGEWGGSWMEEREGSIFGEVGLVSEMKSGLECASGEESDKEGEETGGEGEVEGRGCRQR